MKQGTGISDGGILPEEAEKDQETDDMKKTVKHRLQVKTSTSILFR